MIRGFWPKQATGRMEFVFTEMERSWEGQTWGGNQELGLGHVLPRCPQPSEW